MEIFSAHLIIINNFMEKGVTLDEQQALMDAFDDYWKFNDFYELDKDYNLTRELADIEKDRIVQALNNAEGNQTKAAQILKIGRTCLIAKMKKYDLVYSET
jgi:transcriptional regulator with PAS, ATPase and Fis domain